MPKNNTPSPPAKGEKKQYAFTLEGQLRLEDREWEYDPDDYEKFKVMIAFSRVMEEIDNATEEELPETEISLKEKAIASLVDKLRELYKLDPQGGQSMSGTTDKTPDSSEPSQYQKDMEAKYSKLEQEKNELAQKVEALEKHKELTANYSAHKERARGLLGAGKMTPAQYNKLFEPTEGKDGLQTYAATGSDRVGFLLDQIEEFATPHVKFQSALDGQPLPTKNGASHDDEVDDYLSKK